MQIMLSGWGGSVYYLYKSSFISMIVIELFIVVNKKTL
ncbi:membrane protein [Escherichia coli]|nr:membrane protein [Escherichia coli]AHM34650.1 membrane protein [Escherichia coli]AHM39248.1 membrane protein [Escherichia coli]KDZ20998.1 putative membrane protein [Escherichia coli 3-020-07_S1_C2]